MIVAASNQKEVVEYSQNPGIIASKISLIFFNEKTLTEN